MTTVAERPSILSQYEAFLQGLGSQADRLAELRRQGLEHFERQGFPSTRLEAWRNTNVAPIARQAFRLADRGGHGLTRSKVEALRVPECSELVFVNGHYSAELSRLEELPEGVYAGSLATALESNPELILPHLGRHVDCSEHPFVALNSAYLSDGAFVYVPRGVVVERPLHLLFISTTGDGEPSMSFPRNLFVAEEAGQVTVLESYGGISGETYFTCPVTEIVGGPASVVDHYKLEQESGDAFHVAFQKIYLQRAANFFSHSISHGGALVRNDIQAMLDAEGIECTLNGLYLPRGKQHVDNQMRVDHAKPNCNSYELYKGVLEGRSKAIFNGRIFVHEDAQKTNAKQSNCNLLLSEGSIVQSNPQLEIFADDVRCTHGSTTGELDEEAIFYLRSRGIGEEAARSLLVYAFAAEVLAEIRLDTVRKDLEEFLFTRLPKGDIVRQAV
jgi:Fe-S cluster assembly protein SufD